jgi:hypothetical protein
MTNRSANLPAASAVLFAVAALIDIAFLPVTGSDDAPPLPVMVLYGLLGVGTLAALVPARRGNRRALLTAVVLRVISVMLAVVALFAGPPAWVVIAEAVVVVSTVVALVLLRRRPSLTVPA